MLQYLKHNLGIDVILEKFNNNKKLPFYITEIYHFSVMKFLEKEFLYLEIVDKLPSTTNIKKHIETILLKCNMNCILGISKISMHKRKRLIEEKISFIVPYSQMFVPCIGISLSEKINQSIGRKSSEFFSPATQMLFLHLVYDKLNTTITPTEAAKKLNLSKMTMSRAFAQLLNLGLVTARAEGTKKIFSVIDIPKILFEKGKKHLGSPISRKIYTDNQEVLQNSIVSGVQALSIKTMLNPPKYQIRAIQKNDDRLKNITIYDQDYFDDENAYELELWDYDPGIFCKDGIVDIVSLIATLQEEKNERIQIEINELLEGYQW